MLRMTWESPVRTVQGSTEEEERKSVLKHIVVLSTKAFLTVGLPENGGYSDGEQEGQAQHPLPSAHCLKHDPLSHLK